MNKIRVLIVDDHRIVRDGLKALLECDERIEIVGEAANGEEGVRKAKETDPNVIIMDISMPIMNGRAATLKLRQVVPQARVLVLSSYYDDDLVHDMVSAGVAGFLVKQGCAEDLLKAVHAVTKGETRFSVPIMERFRHARQREKITGRPGKAATTLTAREMQVLELIAEGFSNKGMAAELGISVKTIEKHRQQVMEKLGIHEAAGLTRYALGKGLVPKGGSRALSAAQGPQMQAGNALALTSPEEGEQ